MYGTSQQVRWISLNSRHSVSMKVPLPKSLCNSFILYAQENNMHQNYLQTLFLFHFFEGLTQINIIMSMFSALIIIFTHLLVSPRLYTPKSCITKVGQSRDRVEVTSFIY